MFQHTHGKSLNSLHLTQSVNVKCLLEWKVHAQEEGKCTPYFHFKVNDLRKNPFLRKRGRSCFSTLKAEHRTWITVFSEWIRNKWQNTGLAEDRKLWCQEGWSFTGFSPSFCRSIYTTVSPIRLPSPRFVEYLNINDEISWDLTQ